MLLMKGLGAATLVYLGIILALILSPIVFLLFLWTGLCVFVAIVMFFFCLLITHSAHTLYMSLYLLALGAPAFLVAGVLGYHLGQLRERRAAPMAAAPGRSFSVVRRRLSTEAV